MSVHRKVFGRLVALASLLLLPCLVSAQSATTGTIAGTVKDTTGAVLPGVTVEASSPVLIEKTRSAVTDGQGNYRILELRPGAYTVTFTLTGFATVKREGLELTTGFTANVSPEMRVGAVEETVTVTGASPVVDVQNVRQQQVLGRELWDALPTGKTIQSYVSLTLGATMGASSQDVGGSKGETAGGGSFTYHGANEKDSQIAIDGMAFSGQTTGGAPRTRTVHQNQLAFEETTVGSGVSAEQENAGLQLNLVPREGGNKFSGVFAANGSSPRFQSNNLTADVIARGVPVQGKITKLFDVGGGAGGPIKQNRLWFFVSDRWWNAKNIVPGSFYNATPAPAYGQIPVYTPDSSRPTESSTPHHDDDLRLTWQVSNAQKITFFTELQSACTCYFGVSSSRAPEATVNFAAPYGSKNVYQGNWNYVKGSRWLFSAGNSTFINTNKAGIERSKEMSPTAIPMTDQLTGFSWNAGGADPFPFGGCCFPFIDDKARGWSYTNDQRYSATYSTGSHTLKVGGRTQEYGSAPPSQSYNVTPYGPVALTVRGGVCLTAGCTPTVPVPTAVIAFINPLGPAPGTENTGAMHVLVTSLFAQEQWVVSRLTLNLGVRYDAMHGRYDTFTTVASDYLPSQTLPGVDDQPNWKDITPRLGVAWDLFGNGKTAVKGSWGKFVIHETNVGATPDSRLSYGGGSRTWNDINGNFAPECDYRNPLANGECGPLPNANRGLAASPTTFFDPAYFSGWGVRGFTRSTSLSVQHELRKGFAVNVGYFRTTFGNTSVTDNRAITPADFSEYCVTAPVDARLGSVSGSLLCGLYDLNPSKVGQVNNLVTPATNLGGDPINVFNGVDVSVNARFGKGGVLGGGVSTAHRVSDNCNYVIDRPSRPGYCRSVSSGMPETEVKLFGNYPLPWWGLQVSGTFQNLAGPGIGANLTYTSAQIAPSLGRPLSSGATATASVSLLPPNTLYESRFSQTDIRVTKSVRMQRLRAQLQFDAYNLFNNGSVLGSSGTYGAAWQRVSSIIGARMLKFGVQLDWK